MQGDDFLGVESKKKQKKKQKQTKKNNRGTGSENTQLHEFLLPPSASCMLLPVYVCLAMSAAATAPRSRPLQLLLPDCVRKLAAAPLVRPLQLLLPNSDRLRSHANAVTRASTPPMRRYGYLQTSLVQRPTDARQVSYQFKLVSHFNCVTDKLRAILLFSVIVASNYSFSEFLE